MHSHSQTTENSLHKPDVISSQNTKFKDFPGILYKYDDGHLVFKATKSLSCDNVNILISFKNEADLKANKPYAQVINHGKSNQTTCQYEYYKNFNVIKKQTKLDKKCNVREVSNYDFQ